ncbi:hypothetical protein D3C75_1060180 [compost metagenome]
MGAERRIFQVEYIPAEDKLHYSVLLLVTLFSIVLDGGGCPGLVTKSKMSCPR